MLAAALALLLAAGAADPEDLRAEGVRVSFHPGDRSLADLAVRSAADAKRKTTAVLGTPIDFEVEIALLPDSHYRRWVPDTRGEWSAAIAWPARRSIVLNTGRVNLANNIYETLLHEMVHLGLGVIEERTRRKFPCWFHEGAAQFVVGSIFRGGGGEVAAAAAAGGLIPLGDLCDSFPDTPGRAELAYAESYEAVLFLEKTAGPGALKKVVAAFSEGREFSESLKAAAWCSAAEFEGRWLASVKSGPPHLLVYLAENPWMILVLVMSFGAAALVAGYARHRRNRAALLRRWEEEEGGDGA